MKIKLLLLALLMPMLAFAQFIDEKEARQIATSVLKQKTVNRARKVQGGHTSKEIQLELHRVVKDDEGKEPCFYIYNQKGESKGFAIVSNQGQLLAYSDRGCMDYDNAPDNVKWLLGQYRKILSIKYNNPYPGDDDGDKIEKKRSTYRHSIERLIGSEWHQDNPFNKLIEQKYKDSGANLPSKGIVAGCTTIAMAQVMYKWKYPTWGTGSKKYKVGKSTYTINFDEMIDWNRTGPIPNIRPCDPDVVADLCYRVAASLDSNIGNGVTSAQAKDIPEALTTYFKYDASVRDESKWSLSAEVYEDIAYSELEQGRPCIIYGQDNLILSVGHTMVVEGYNAETELFFINMGFGMGGADENHLYNAEYALTVANSYHHYIYFQHIITHIKPDNGGCPTPHIFAPTYATIQAVGNARPRRAIEYDKNEGSKTYHVSAQIFSNDMDANIVTGIIAKDYVTGKECVFEGSTHNLKQNYLQDMSFDIDLNKIEYNGYYKLRPVFRMVDDDEWFTIEVQTENEDEPIERTCVDVSNAKVLDLGEKIEFTLDQTSIKMGSSTQIEYRLPIKGVPMTFTSSDPSIASVDENGIITGLQPGEVTITAHCDDYYYNGNRLVNETTKEFQLIIKGTVYQGDLIVNGDLTGNDMSSFQMKEYGVEPEVIKDAAILKGGGPNGENCIVVNSVAKVYNEWDSQFWIVFNQEIYDPATIKIKFQFKASSNTYISTQAQCNPGEYNCYSVMGYLNFTEEWQTFESTISVRPEMTRSDGGSGEERGFKSISFQLSKEKDISFYFANLEVSVVNESHGYDDKVLQMSKVVDGVEYALYKRTIDVDNVHRNPDGWTTYRSELLLDVTKNGNKTTYVVDDNIYLDNQSGYNQQRPCMMFDLNTRQIYIFCNSKDSGPYYSMDGFFYSSSLDNISFKKETVFNTANWGWWPYFVESEDGTIAINHFSYAGYYNSRSTRISEGNWNTEMVYSIWPDDYIEQYFLANDVLVTDKNNPSVTTNIIGRVVLEEFTGTWCGWCPRGTLALDLLNKEYGDNIITIAVHYGDPMEGSYALSASSFPSAMVNRYYRTDPYYGNNNNPFGIKQLVEAERNKYAPAEIEVSAAWGKKDKTAITIDTKTTFQVDGDASRYGIGFVLLEDGMKGNGSSWAQANNYSGTSTDDQNLLPITNLPSMITDIEYNHVAVDSWGLINGVDGSIKNIEINVPQDFQYKCNISTNGLIQDKSKLSIVALLIDRKTGRICNAAKTAIADYDPSNEPHYDVGHVVKAINFIMGGNATPDDMALYDMNNDGELNIGDVILIVKFILDNGGSVQSAARSKSPMIDDLTKYTAVQFNLKTGNASVKDIRLVENMEQSHQLMYRQIAPGTYTVVIYSQSNQLLNPDNGQIILVEANEGKSETMTVQNVTAAMPTGETEHYKGQSVITGILGVDNSEKPAVVYDLKGQRHNDNMDQKSGVYIINGKKTVVK